MRKFINTITNNNTPVAPEPVQQPNRAPSETNPKPRVDSDGQDEGRQR